MVGLGVDETLFGKADVPQPNEASVSNIPAAIEAAVSVFVVVIVVIASCSFRHL